MSTIVTYIMNFSIAAFFRLFVAYLIAVLVAYSATSFSQSLCVLVALEDAGAEIPLALWAHTLWYDSIHLAFGGHFFSYAIIIMIGFIVALPTAAFVRKLSGLPEILLYPSAGATAMATQDYIFDAYLYDLSFSLGTRGVTGLTLLLLSGAVGGLAFLITIKHKRIFS